MMGFAVLQDAKKASMIIGIVAMGERLFLQHWPLLKRVISKRKKTMWLLLLAMVP